MQCSVLTEERQKNELAQKERRLIKTTTTSTAAAAITLSSSPAHQRCTASKDGKFQGGHFQQINAVEFVD
jgi:hypothetical protein